jgi:hypothetical protein
MTNSTSAVEETIVAVSAMTKAQLVAHITGLETKIIELEDMNLTQDCMLDDMTCSLESLESRLGKAPAVKGASVGRNVLSYMMEHGHCKISDIAKSLGCTPTNVSSYLSYLRRGKYSVIVAIATDSRGFKFIEDMDDAATLMADVKF